VGTGVGSAVGDADGVSAGVVTASGVLLTDVTSTFAPVPSAQPPAAHTMAAVRHISKAAAAILFNLYH